MGYLHSSSTHDTILVPAVFCSLRQRRFEMTETKIPVECLVVCGIFDTVSLKSRSFVLSPHLLLEDKPNPKAAFVWWAHKVMTKNFDVFSQNRFLRASIEMGCGIGNWADAQDSHAGWTSDSFPTMTAESGGFKVGVWWCLCFPVGLFLNGFLPFEFLETVRFLTLDKMGCNSKTNRLHV